MLTKQLIWGGLKSTKRGRYDYHSAIKTKDLIDLDDLRWVLVSNYRPFLPTRSTSRVIAENRFFNLFLFAVDGTAGTGRPSTAGRPPVRVRVRVRSTTISSPQQQGSEVWGLKNGPFLRLHKLRKKFSSKGLRSEGLKKVLSKLRKKFLDQVRYKLQHKR